MAYRDAKRVYDLDKKLYAQKAIGLQEYQIAVNTYNYALAKRNLNAQVLKQDSQLGKSAGTSIGRGLQQHEKYTRPDETKGGRPGG